MGQIYQALARFDDQEGHLQRALECYRDVLHHWTPDTSPINYARVQKDLGSAYAELAEIRDRRTHLNRAIEHYQVALRYLKPGVSSLDYAATLELLGTAYDASGIPVDALKYWREASAQYRTIGSFEASNRVAKWIERASRR